MGRAGSSVLAGHRRRLRHVAQADDRRGRGRGQRSARAAEPAHAAGPWRRWAAPARIGAPSWRATCSIPRRRPLSTSLDSAPATRRGGGRCRPSQPGSRRGVRSDRSAPHIDSCRFGRADTSGRSPPGRLSHAADPVRTIGRGVLERLLPADHVGELLPRPRAVDRGARDQRDAVVDLWLVTAVRRSDRPRCRGPARAAWPGPGAHPVV